MAPLPENPNRKKILSLDGGGSWAILQAMALQEIYKDLPGGTNCRNILNDFDLIVANSGGSLILAAMIEYADDDIQVVIDMMRTETIRKKIFVKLGLFDRLLRVFGLDIGPKYDASKKEKGFLYALPKFGETNMSELSALRNIPKNIIICGFDYDTTRATFFKTNQNPNKPNKYRLVDAINASSNAPVNYFNGPVQFKFDSEIHHRFWDGAVGGYNNPILVGITEALNVFNEDNTTLHDLKILSIGTGNNLIPIEDYTITNMRREGYPQLVQKKKSAGLKNDIPKMATSILSEPPDAANYIAHMVLGGIYNGDDAKPIEAEFVRLNPLVQPVLNDGKWDFPKNITDEKDKRIFTDLIELDMDAVEQEKVDMIFKLGEWWINDDVVNQSVRYNGQNFNTTIGTGRFSLGKKQWLRIR